MTTNNEPTLAEPTIEGAARTELSFEDWYRDNYLRLLRSMIVITRDPSVASDLTDEAFVRALERWSRVATMDSPIGWTYRVAVNLVKRHGRRHRRERDALDHLTARESIQAVALPERSFEIWAAVAALPPRMQIAIALRYGGDLTEAETANAMGIRPGTIARLLHDGRLRLAAALHETQGDGP